MEDLEIIKVVIDGDINQYRKIVEKYQNQIYSLIRKQVRSDDIAEDLAQEVFIKAYKNLKSFRNEAKFSTWLITIALNQANSYFRSKNYKKKLNSVIMEEELINMNEDQEKKIITNEKISQLHKCLTKIKSQFRDVVNLCAFQEKNYQEASEILSVPIGTVRSRLNRARLILISCMGGENYE